jgi:hypothetical protein
LLAVGEESEAAAERRSLTAVAQYSKGGSKVQLAVLTDYAAILWESGGGSDVMKPIAAPIVGGLISSTIQVLILVPVLFAIMKERELYKDTLNASLIASSGRGECIYRFE